ncbi:MAG: nuclear transport factor 2 family protein [Phycisphaera sp.]|nr:MAG: nuclear transport factor 2 family protein [Phycisphaera sp.]
MGSRKKFAGSCALVIGMTSLVVVADGVRSAATDPTPEFDAARVTEELDGFLPGYIRTLESDNNQAIAGLYVADDRFTWFTDGRALYSSAQDVLKSLDGLEASGMELHTALTNVSVVPLAQSLATLSAEFSTRATTEGQEAFAYAGVMTMVVERQADGQWKVVRGHSSTPAGPPR